MPLYRGYLFLHYAMDKMSYLEVLKTRGLVGVLGDHADRLAAIPDQEIEAIRRIIVMDLEGILVRSNPQQGHVDGTLVEAA